MEMLRDVRQSYHDTEKGNRGVSLPSLSTSGGHWGNVDPSLSAGLLSARTSCQPIPPTNRPRTRSVVVSSTPSYCLLSVAESTQLSQSAPSVMEPLLCSNTMMQARAHVQTRLGSQNNVTEVNDLLPAPHPRTPKLLAPLDSRLRDTTAPLVLKQHVPLKPISRSLLCSRTRLRRERLSCANPHNGPLIAKTDSEETRSSSTSTSSHSSFNIEDEDVDRSDRSACGDSNPTPLGDVLLQHLKDMASTKTDLAGEKRLNVRDQSRINDDELTHRSIRDCEGGLNYHTKDVLSTERVIKACCEYNVTNVNFTKESFDSLSLKMADCARNGESAASHVETINNVLPFTSDSEEEEESVDFTTKPDIEISQCTLNDNQDGSIACSDWKYRNIRKPPKQTIDSSTEKHQLEKTMDGTKKASTAVRKAPYFTATASFNVSENTFTALKHIHNNEKRTDTNHKQNASIQTNYYPKILSQKDQNKPNGNQSKGYPRYPSLSSKVTDKTRESPELIVRKESAVAKVKSKMRPAKGANFNINVPSSKKKTVDYSPSKRVHPDKQSSNNTQQHTPARELKSARQEKKPNVADDIPRSKSAVDLITYKDMFQQMQSGDEGPAIYEMFAGPIYDNIRASSSCGRLKERHVQSAPSRKPQQINKVKHKLLKPTQSKMRRSPGESMVVSAKSKAKPVPPKMKPHLMPVSRKGNHKTKQTVSTQPELALAKDVGTCPKGDNDKEEICTLSTIHESKHGTATLKSPDKTPITQKTPSQTKNSRYIQTNLLEMVVKPSPESPNQSNSEVPQSLQQPKINTWTSDSSSSHTTISPVYRKFLDEVGDGPLTEDLLQCLAEELISLDERALSVGQLSENLEQSREESSQGKDPISRQNPLPEVVSADCGALFGSGFAGDHSITWTKGEVLGRGAYGTVYCGLTSQGQLIAVKQVSLDSSDPEAAKKEYNRLQGEVELLKTLRHINIVGFLGTSLYQHAVSIFMEYVPGGSIASILHRFGPLPERVLALYTQQILDGVAYLHLNQVIHRDLKGNNIMLMPTGVIKLIDFGCARRLSCLNHTASNSGDLLKSVHGTPYWMAPEVINETGYGRKSDIWSVGCTVFEMATGKPPLAHMDKMAALFYIGAQRGVMPSLPAGFSEDAKDFVKICLTSNQKLRPDADQLLKHSFVPQKEANANSRETQLKSCCGHREGLCG
ncbi:mitogen-activated protein kinase kinase kinase 19 isoform X2 [Salarias fasciatus]|uniref:mitogen-activated protein kinase kinase kinase 19 isoform X2 n=1 Tax=Salarias fasciatus TaxID=181472 RepID=UPI001176D44F|nr:mitogen-activated protein kinase kinase kinase 19 isoform X2 [Salarias fasciatus]